MRQSMTVSKRSVRYGPTAPEARRVDHVPVLYLGDKRPAPLYPGYVGQRAEIVAELCRYPYPLVLEFTDGSRGIARRDCVKRIR